VVVLVNFENTGNGRSSSISPVSAGPASLPQQVALERLARLADIFVGEDLLVPETNWRVELEKRALDYAGISVSAPLGGHSPWRSLRTPEGDSSLHAWRRCPTAAPPRVRPQ